MAITFTPKTNIKEIDVEGYGLIRIRPYGAGEELQIQANLRKLEELQSQAESLLAEAKEKYGEDEAKLPQEFKDRFKKIQDEVVVLTDELNEMTMAVVTSERPGVAKRLLKELPTSELRRLITSAREENNAKAK